MERFNQSTIKNALQPFRNGRLLYFRRCTTA
nr:MAG TPA: hypothetical protein [Caudoviricetes sp.]DAZ17906.1 MAG TPA: hypothetical protein [Caudoviricetes sp.]